MPFLSFQLLLLLLECDAHHLICTGFMCLGKSALALVVIPTNHLFGGLLKGWRIAHPTKQIVSLFFFFIFNFNTNYHSFTDDFPASKIFDVIDQGLKADPALVKKTIKSTNALVVFKLVNASKKTEAWHLDLKKTGAVGKGDKEGADITLTLSDENFANLVSGKANAQKLFMSGKLKVKGNVMKAASIENVLKAAKAKL